MSWLDVAKGDLPIRSELDVDGDRGSYLRWHTGRPKSLVFVHGGGAHAHWWDHLAPKFRDYDVVALDLLGHGDSDWRHDYSQDVWTRQIAAVVEHANFETKPIVIGHSLGGVLASLALHRYPDLASMLVVIDSALELPQREGDYHRRLARHTPRIHSNDDPREKRFVLLPVQPLGERDVIDHIAFFGGKPVPGGWQWKFDPRIFGLTPWKLGSVSCPAAIIRGELSSVMSVEQAALFAKALGNVTATVTIPNAYHHVLLDQPGALVAELAKLIA